jgi:hypothetical protein
MNKHVITYLSSKWKGTLHINGYKLYSSSRRLIPLFMRGRIHKGASQQKRKEVSQILSFQNAAI